MGPDAARMAVGAYDVDCPEDELSPGDGACQVLCDDSECSKAARLCAASPACTAVALSGGRLRIARMTLVTGEPPAPAVVGADDFDPSDHAAFAEIAGFVFGGPPRGQ